LRIRDAGDIYIDDVFYATPGRTINAALQFEGMLDGEGIAAFRAMLAGAPLVTAVEDCGLDLAHILRAYERAIELADRFVEVVDAGVSEDDNIFRLHLEKTDAGVFFFPDLEAEPAASAAAILKAASPAAYSAAERLCERLKGTSGKELAEAVNQICRNWWKPPWVDDSDGDKLSALSWSLDHLARKQDALKRYEGERASWIALSGSQQLKRAAARKYRHDGIYRDERLAAELPGFAASLGRKPTIRDLINPSAEALEAEDELLTLARRLGITDKQVRLVWADPDNDMPAGEYLQIKDYLGRHTVWRAVDPERQLDEIPF
jgi:hypothetical protein